MINKRGQFCKNRTLKKSSLNSGFVYRERENVFRARLWFINMFFRFHTYFIAIHTEFTVKFRTGSHMFVSHTPCFTSHFIPSLPHSLVVYIARSVFTVVGAGALHNERGAALSLLCRSLLPQREATRNGHLPAACPRHLGPLTCPSVLELVLVLGSGSGLGLARFRASSGLGLGLGLVLGLGLGPLPAALTLSSSCGYRVGRGGGQAAPAGSICGRGLQQLLVIVGCGN